MGTITAFIVGLLLYVSYNPQHTELISNVGGNGLILLVILGFIVMAMRKKVNVYESFIDGAKDGFQVAIRIIPYLIAMLCAITVLRASGSIDVVLYGIKEAVLYVGLTATEWVDALPVAFMKPMSGSGARAALVEIIDQFGIESLQARIAATMQGSTETTLYVLAVYFGSVGIKNTRYAAAAGLLCDLIGIIGAIVVAYIFFGNA
jgi:spore maturation protein SpmB